MPWAGAAGAPPASLCHGDRNCDGHIDFGDINGDGTYGQASFTAINPLVALLSAGLSPART